MDITLKNAEVKKLEAQAKMDKLMGGIGNIVGPKVPIFKDEEIIDENGNVTVQNKIERTWGTIPDLKVTGDKLGSLHHHQIMECLDIVEFEQGSKIAGHRGYYLKGAGVLMNQALINYGLATLIEKDFTPI